MSDVKLSLKENEGVYDIVASKRIADRTLKNAPTIFECELGIRDTDYKRKKSVIYYPGKFLILQSFFLELNLERFGKNMSKTMCSK
jgi:hypothetical protein